MADVSNADILREIKDVQHDSAEVRKMVLDHEQRVRKLENFQIAYEAAAKALEGVNRPTQTLGGLNKDFANVVLKALGFLTALVSLLYLIVQSVSK